MRNDDQIGGEGFLGHTIILMLRQRCPQASIHSLDIVQRHWPEKREWSFISADLTDIESLSQAFKQSAATVVFHTASPLFASAGNESLMEKINVQGTQTIVDACLACKVPKLVYTSTSGVAYNGANVINVDERIPDAEPPLDYYTKTKVGITLV